ncbi:hypothetical protein QJQ45_004121 [Haematococcus lacustris]|nr:hypothetical protein QJQ45_004121 [Haematococcus lacustris]
MACGYGINAKSSELKAATLDKGHVAELIEEADKHRRLLGMKKQGSLQDTLPLPCRMRHAVHVCRWLEQWQQPHTPPVPGQPKRGKRRGVGPRTLTCPPPFTLTPMARVGVHFIKVDSRVLHGVPTPAASTSSSNCRPSAAAAAAHAVGLPHIGKGVAETREYVFDPDTQIGVGIDPGVTQALSAASGTQSGDTERWLAPIKPHLQHLAAASSAGTSLEANLKHITVTLATWDAVWEVYLDPKWARQRLRLYGAQDRALEQFFNKVRVGGWVAGGGHGYEGGVGKFHGKPKLLEKATARRTAHRVMAKKKEEELNKLSATRPAGWKPPAGQVEQRLLRPAWSQQHDQPVRGLMWCPVVPPRKPPQAPGSSQEATPAAASEAGPSTPPPAERSKRTKAEPAAEPIEGKGKGKGKAAKAKPAPQPPLHDSPRGQAIV